jgi:hypothetical protein
MINMHLVDQNVFDVSNGIRMDLEQTFAALSVSVGPDSLRFSNVPIHQ